MDGEELRRRLKEIQEIKGEKSEKGDGSSRKKNVRL